MYLYNYIPFKYELNKLRRKMQFKDKTAIVTGASSGIGKSTAELYSKEGANVVLSDIDEKKGNEAAEAINNNGGSAIFVRADVSSPDDCKSLVEQTLKEFGRLDYACNNAGIAGESNPVADYSIENWNKVIAVNLSSVFYCMKYQIESMLKSGGGSIINMASILGSVAFANAPAYVAAKHGVVGLTKNATVEYAKKNIRVNSIGPAFIHTPLIESLEQDKETYDYLVSLHPIGRLGKPEEVAELVIWLSSDKASFVTGSYYPVDGGYLAK
jgi:NAD(P)-dependent dehydrogenase (short-subunit alcohol dehydrogenase family)